jgi:DNA repair exonuclease SbcCD ATPase subunit
MSPDRAATRSPEVLGSPVVFERLVVDGFRGFNSRTEIEMAASVVLIQGPNGLGKTSLFDAMQWVLLGDLPRLRSLRLRQSDEYIVSAYRPGERAEVSAQVRIGSQRVLLRRTGDRSGSVLTWTPEAGIELTGREADAALAAAFSVSADMAIEDSLTACGLLQQDAARLVLQAAPRERFAVFSQLLGLSELAEFEEWCQSRDKALTSDLKNAEAEFARAEQQQSLIAARLATLVDLARQRPVIAEVEERLHASAGRTGLKLPAVGDRNAAARVAASAAVLSRDAALLATDIRGLRDTEGILLAQAASLVPSGPTTSDEALAAAEGDARQRLGDAEAAAAAAEVDIQSAALELRRMQDAQASLARMAAAVLPHVTGPVCPICSQAVDENELRAHLQRLEGAVSGSAARATLEASEARAAQVRETVSEASRELEAIRQLRAQLQQWEIDVARVRERIEELRSTSEPLVLPRWAGPLLEGGAWLSSMSDAGTVVAALARELTAVWDASASNEEARAVHERAEVDQRVAALQERRARLAGARNAASTLLRAVKEARVEVVRQEFSRISPLAQDVYSRLDPHPTFQDIDLVPEVFRAAGTASASVRDPLLGISADPMLVFSSAQANIAAISFVVALNWAAANRVPVLMLDDPLQAMDDINVLGFADLCRHLRHFRQLIISTHEKRFAQLLERKLAPRREGDRTLAVDFLGWDRSGPMIKTRDVPDQIGEMRAVLQPPMGAPSEVDSALQLRED